MARLRGLGFWGSRRVTARTVGTGYGRRGCAWSTCSWSVIQTDTAAGTIGSYSPYENNPVQCAQCAVATALSGIPVKFRLRDGRRTRVTTRTNPRLAPRRGQSPARINRSSAAVPRPDAPGATRPTPSRVGRRLVPSVVSPGSALISGRGDAGANRHPRTVRRGHTATTLWPTYDDS